MNALEYAVNRAWRWYFKYEGYDNTEVRAAIYAYRRAQEWSEIARHLGQQVRRVPILPA